MQALASSSSGAVAAGANVFAAKKVKLELPPVFKGNPNALTAWLFSIEQCCEMVDLTEDSDQVKLAVSRLGGDALTWWHSFGAKEVDPLNNITWARL